MKNNKRAFKNVTLFLASRYWVRGQFQHSSDWLFKAEGFPVSCIQFVRWESLLLRLFLCLKTRVHHHKKTKRLVPWREQDAGLSVQCNGDGYRLLRISSGKGLIVDFSTIHSKDAKSENLDLCNEEGALGFGSPSKGLMGDESLSDLSFQSFVSFSKFVGLPVQRHEKEFSSLLRKLEARKDWVFAMKRSPSFTFHVDWELQNLENWIN